MEVGVLTVPLGEWSLEKTLDYLDGLGVSAIELGSGGHPGTAHISPESLLNDSDKRGTLERLLDKYGMTVSALATHNNPLHPDEKRSSEADEELRRSIDLAARLDIGCVTCFSGLPAGAPDDETPNWITAPWPTEHREVLDYQWEVATDYWTDIAQFAETKGVDIAIEMHPNMLVYHPHGLVRLRERCGDRIGANFDPSHLYWQGIDMQSAIRYLAAEAAIHHVHAKDTELYETKIQTKGVLDTESYADEKERSWLFRTVGYGHGEQHWRRFVSTLRLVGYDGVLSIEHEDALMSSREGLKKAISLLQRVVPKTQPGDAFWAE